MRSRVSFRRLRSLLRPAFIQVCVVSFLGAHAPNLFVVTPKYLSGTLGFDEAEIGSVMGAFALAVLAAMPFAARVAERLGARAGFVLGLILTAAGCALFEGQTDVRVLAAMRALQGVGWSGVLVGGAIYATELAPPGRLGQALGVAGVLTLVAMALGPLFGELILAHLDPVWLFRAAALMSVLGAGVAALLPGIPRPEHRAKQGPRFPPPVRRPLVATFLVAMGFGAVIAFLADYTAKIDIPSVSPFFNAYVASAIAVRLFAGSLSDRVGRLPVIIPALVGQALALVGLALLTSTWQLWPIGVVFGLTHGLYYPSMQAIVVERTDAAARARAIAASSFAFSAGITCSAFGNGVLARHLGYRAAFVVCAVMAVGGAGTLLTETPEMSKQ